MNLWPSDIRAIDVNWTATDQIEQFSVNFNYDYWIVNGGTTGDGGGQ